MPILHLLGTGSAVTDPHRTTTMLAFANGVSTFVVDCGGDVVRRLQASGINLDTIDALFVTHEHPDHVSGFPLFLEKIWLAGRTRPLHVYGITRALDQARRCFAAFDTSSWDMPEILYHDVPYREGASVLENDTFRVTASPGIHAVPVVGLRVESKQSGQVVTYSCDTEPAESICRLARASDILVHEANGPMRGHTSVEGAARIAAEAQARRLLLIHLPAGVTDQDLQGARGVFPAVELGEELGQYPF